MDQILNLKEVTQYLSSYCRGQYISLNKFNAVITKASAALGKGVALMDAMERGQPVSNAAM